MMRATLWAQCALCLLLCYNTQAQTTYAQFGSTPSTVADDGSGIGIGTTAPEATLHINGAAGTDPLLKVSHTFNSPHYFVGESNVASGGFPPTFTTHRRFVITSQGYVGIGEVDPEEPLTIKHRYDYTPTPPYYSPLATNRVMTIRDKDDDEVISIGVSSDGTNHGAMMMVRSTPDVPGFVVWNGSTNSHVMVAGNGSFGLGLGITDQPAAHLDIRKITGLDYLLNIANSDNTSQYLTVNKDGNVGIGVVATSGTAKLSVAGNIDMYNTSAGNSYLRIRSAAGATRHYITEEEDYLVIAPGVGDGAIDKVVVAGQLAVVEKAIPQSGIDMGEIDPGSNGWYNQIAFRDGAGTSQQVLCNAGNDLILNLNPFGEGSGKLKVAGSVVIGATAPTGTYSGYKLGVDGDIVAKKVIVQTGSWADKVFEKDYKLQSLIQVEQYIKTNGHLPEIPSECEVLDNGVDVGEMNKLLLQKVEELTLYMIELQKQVDLLNKK